MSSILIKQEVGFYLHREGPNLGKHLCPLLPVTISLDAQIGTPYPRSAGFDTNSGPPPLIPAPMLFFFLPKNHYPAQARVLAHFAAIFDLLAQSSIHKTSLGDCSLVCDSSNGPISFCSSALFIANFCCLGDPVLELACQIYMVPSSSNA